MKITNELLEKFSIFKTLDEKDLKELVGKSEFKNYERDDRVCAENSSADRMYFVCSGSVDIKKGGVHLATLQNCDYFGEMSIIEDTDRTASAYANTKTLLLEIKSEFIKKVILNNTHSMLDLVTTYDQRLRKHNQLVVKQFNELKDQYQELKRNNDQLLQTDKLASIGMITAGIAHEINNPLTILKSDVSLMTKKIEKLDEKEMLSKMTNRMNRAVESIQKIVIGIKSYVRVSEEETQKISLNETIQGSIDLVSYLYQQKKIQLETSLCDENPTIMGNIGQLQQVIINLLSNASDAMEDSSTKKITIETIVKNGNVDILVHDTGQGIPEKNLPGIFEKFFTTKPVGKGTGLGLEIVSSIVKKMEGDIGVKSKVGEGSTFSISVPIVS